MGLAERRAVQKFKDEGFAGCVEKVQAAAGFAVPVEVVWEGMQVPGITSELPQVIDQVFFQPLSLALAAVAIDDMGREALRTSLQKVVISNQTENFDSTKFSYEAGVLRMDHRLVNAHAVMDRARSLQRLLESKL